MWVGAGKWSRATEREGKRERGRSVSGWVGRRWPEQGEGEGEGGGCLMVLHYNKVLRRCIGALAVRQILSSP